MTMLSKQEKLKYCAGCDDNFYNGNNPMGIRECWHLDKARLVMKKEVPMNLPPPWKMSLIEVLSCCHYAGYVLVEPRSEY